MPLGPLAKASRSGLASSPAALVVPKKRVVRPVVDVSASRKPVSAARRAAASGPKPRPSSNALRTHSSPAPAAATLRPRTPEDAALLQHAPFLAARAQVPATRVTGGRHQKYGDVRKLSTRLPARTAVPSVPATAVSHPNRASSSAAETTEAVSTTPVAGSTVSPSDAAAKKTKKVAPSTPRPKKAAFTARHVDPLAPRRSVPPKKAPPAADIFGEKPSVTVIKRTTAPVTNVPSSSSRSSKTRSPTCPLLNTSFLAQQALEENDAQARQRREELDRSLSFQSGAGNSHTSAGSAAASLSVTSTTATVMHMRQFRFPFSPAAMSAAGISHASVSGAEEIHDCRTYNPAAHMSSTSYSHARSHTLSSGTPEPEDDAPVPYASFPCAKKVTAAGCYGADACAASEMHSAAQINSATADSLPSMSYQSI